MRSWSNSSQVAQVMDPNPLLMMGTCLALIPALEFYRVA